jgi:hypothetical protein
MALTATTPLYNSTVTVIWVMTLYCYTFSAVLWVHFWNSFSRDPYVEFSLRKI